jgi:hypothetical protein
MKCSISWDIMSCSLLKDNRCFGGIRRSHFQSRTISQVGDQHKASSKQDIFIRNVGCLSNEHMTLYHTRKKSVHNLFLAKIPSHLKILILTDFLSVIIFLPKSCHSILVLSYLCFIRG